MGTAPEARKPPARVLGPGSLQPQPVLPAIAVVVVPMAVNVMPMVPVMPVVVPMRLCRTGAEKRKSERGRNQESHWVSPFFGW